MLLRYYSVVERRSGLPSGNSEVECVEWIGTKEKNVEK